MDRGQGSSDPGISDPVARGLAMIAEGVELVRSGRCWSMPERELLTSVTDLAALRAQAYGAHLHLLRVVEERDAARVTGAPSTAAWLRTALRLSPGRAKADVEAAQVTDPDGGSLAALGHALDRGEVSPEHVDTCARTLAKIPRHLRERTLDPAQADGIRALSDQAGEAGPAGDDHWGDEPEPAGPVARVVEQWLLRQSRRYHPLDVARLSRHLIAVADPSGQDRFDPLAFERRYLRLGADPTGMTFGSFQLDPSGALVKTMIDFLSAPGAGLSIDEDDAVEPAPDTRRPEQRRADALVEMARLAAAYVQGERTRAAEPPLVLVHATLAQAAAAFGSGSTAALPAPPGLATCEQTGPLSPASLRALGCDASWQLLLTSDAGAPLWLGRSERFASRAQRRALAARDRGCAHPGCQRPTSWCEAHHVPGWSRGSPTDIDAMVLLCPAHHTLCDLGVWQVEVVDGIPWFVPPTWVDPEQRRLRNHWPEDVDRAHRLGQLLRDALGPGP